MLSRKTWFQMGTTAEVQHNGSFLTAVTDGSEVCAASRVTSSRTVSAPLPAVSGCLQQRVCDT